MLFFSACGWIGGTIQFFEGLRLTWRDKVVGLPLGYLCIIFAHDAYFFLHFDFWFNQVDHWYFNITTYLFATWPVIEIFAIIWLVRVARNEVAPQLCIIAMSLAYLLIYEYYRRQERLAQATALQPQIRRNAAH